MWLKESEADMKGLNGEDPYSVATVPWTQFFYPDDDLALHTAYWHDQFGKPRSRGCVNLAPRDARWLYYWSDPQGRSRELHAEAGSDLLFAYPGNSRI